MRQRPAPYILLRDTQNYSKYVGCTRQRSVENPGFPLHLQERYMQRQVPCKCTEASLENYAGGGTLGTWMQPLRSFIQKLMEEDAEIHIKAPDRAPEVKRRMRKGIIQEDPTSGLWINKPGPAPRKNPESNRILPLRPVTQIRHPRELSLPPSLPISTFELPQSPSRTQAHPDAITPQGRLQSPSGTQEHPDNIGPGGHRCNQTILEQEDPGAPQTSLDQEVPEEPIFLYTKRTQEHPNSTRQRGLKSNQTPLDQETYPCPIIQGKNGVTSMQKYLQHHKEQDNTRI
ncbi:hypothetical protein STEG23_025675 [Scotinomys teguina]